ncbi:NAD(P)-dependent oxidoreductase [Luteolibacter sp. AS25]|uniref:NAD(P)-dependent oxidoreductase n=1 Tax=Luteolibacter sp. AS25 TaxID=3135776 RepID=UPI00398A84BA
MPKQTIFVSEISYAKGKEVFTRLSGTTDFIFTPVAEDEPTLSDLIKKQNVRGFIADIYPYTGALYSALPAGAAISRFGVGHDSIDKDKATAAGIHVANTPGVLNTSVAEHAMWLLGSLARNVASLDRSMRSEKWEPKRGIEVHGKTLAILGFGRIAQDICRKAHHGFGMNVIGFDQFDQDTFCKFAKVETFEEFQREVPVQRITTDLEDAVANADFVLMMMAVTPETVGMANAELFSKMRNDAYFLNTARGALVNEDDLFDALTNGIIAGAALDVFMHEPYVPQSPEKDLRTLGNIVITPHVASNTAETNAAMAEASAKNIMTILSEGPDACPNIVNR